MSDEQTLCQHLKFEVVETRTDQDIVCVDCGQYLIDGDFYGEKYYNLSQNVWQYEER